MDTLFLSNLTSPPLLFFMLGAAAAALRSDLEIPEQIAKSLSLYLLFAIGFKGGVALAESSLNNQVVASLGAALLLSVVVPVYAFFLLKRNLSIADAAATAATYGSISAVTFVTATSFLDANGIAWGGHLVAAMALMESPAIILGLLLYRLYREQKPSAPSQLLDGRELFRESFLNGSVFLIVGSLVVGWISGPQGKLQIGVFVDDLFIGVLCLFLLDMGIVAMRRLMDLRGDIATVKPLGLAAWGLLLPVLNAGLATLLAVALELSVGDAMLLVVLAASASYIAVPAAMRLALPEANPSVYLAMSLAITFPFNLLIGIPMYYEVMNYLL